MTDFVEVYSRRRDQYLEQLAISIEGRVKDILLENNAQRVDNVSSRAKSVSSFEKKSKSTVDGRPQYDYPLTSIQDQIGVRITVFYSSDVFKVENIIKKHLNTIEVKELEPASAWSFGYFGRHLLPIIPLDLIPEDVEEDEIPPCFELQIKTLFQHAWAQANHDLGYKPELGGLSLEEERKLAFASAQAWGADHHFNELFLAKHSSANDD